eukprot:CAMPEP_0116896792 /NCGR_PEP_ID=MMETSP0467-20121206/5953_1 /TAXON_ID=283647 /ORGANISM="Mesodinium pulex, Strain SPMC105" /LENGTH=81 /DNA_ID=CAMNT_0004568151 /DNA_START=864 /DNA_END=1109 /DNA_ORIENTATION=+
MFKNSFDIFDKIEKEMEGHMGIGGLGGMHHEGHGAFHHKGGEEEELRRLKNENAGDHFRLMQEEHRLHSAQKELHHMANLE